MSMRQLRISKSITIRESKSLEKYLQEVGKIELIKPEEEVELAVKIRKGDQKALERLINGNLRFVVSVAKQYQNQGLTLSDLINEGNFGLIKAAERFDETKGFRFISYAVWWIRQSLLQAIAEHSRIVRLPLNKVGITNRLSKAREVLEQQFEREPTTEELAGLLKLDIEDVSNSLMWSMHHLSVDTPLSDEDDSTMIDVLVNNNAHQADEKLVYDESLKKEIQSTLERLPIKHRRIVCYYFGIGVDHPLSLEEISKRYSITRERVRQIKDKALKRLRQESKHNDLRLYLR